VGEPLVGAEGLLEAVSLKVMESMDRERVMNARWKWVPDCNTKATGGKGSVNTRNRQQISVYCLQNVENVWECDNLEVNRGKQGEWSRE